MDKSGDLFPEAPHSSREFAGLVFLVLVAGLGKRAGRVALKSLKRPGRFCWGLVSERRVQPDVVVVVLP